MPDTLETLLLNIEATGRLRSKQFALGPTAREGFVKLAEFSTSAAATAWADFLKLKGTKLHIPQVVMHDLPEFLDERLVTLRNPAPTSVFPTSGHIRHSGIEAIRKQAEMDPLTDEHREDMLDFVRNLGRNHG
jgi:hypothetical protein